MASKKSKGTAKPANVVGPVLRKYRMEAGLTQKELAARCEECGLKLTRGTLAKIGSCLRFVTAEELFVLGKVLKIASDRFFPPGFGDPVAGDQ
jgi:transcriptional regulator with XRE-family HTH domain